MQRDELVRYLDEYLRIGEFKDYGPQGLQVEGRDSVKVIVGMVDAHLPSVEAALRGRSRPAARSPWHSVGTRAAAERPLWTSRAHLHGGQSQSVCRASGA